MKLSEFSIKRPVTIFMAIIAVLIFGIVSYTRLNLDMLPAMDMPMVMINTGNQGASPSDIEETITKPLEQIVSTVSNVEKVSSVSSDGTSMIMVQFEDGTDMDFASLELREKIDMVKPLLPKDARAPMIIGMDPSMMPIMNFGVSFSGEDKDKIGEFSDEVLKSAIESVEGVASVDFSGEVEKGIKIEVDNDKLGSYGVNMQTLMAAIKSEELNYPIGEIIEGDYEVLVRTFNKIDSLDSIKNIRIKTNTGDVLKLSDLATVKFEDKKGKSFSKINGNDALIGMIQKESTANTVDVTRAVNKKLDELKEKNENLQVIKIMDQGEVIEFMVNSVKRNAVVGAILAIIVLLVFLKDFRTTIIMAISIPISIVWTFVMVYFSGLTLNMISLGGIALGVGMLVDNSIVVIESIYRYKKLGYENKEAALVGTKEVSTAIMASTLTSICVFLPIVFVEGMAADIFKEMALTVTFSLVSSLIVSFTLVPVLASRLLNKKSLNKENKTVEKLKIIYEKVLRYSLKNKKSIMGMVLVFIITGIVALTSIGLEFFPTSDQGIINVKISVPKASKDGFTQSIGFDILSKLEGIEEIDTVSVNGDNEKATMYVILKKDREKSDKELVKEIREVIPSEAGANIEVTTGGTQMSAGSPVAISIRGKDFSKLEEISTNVLEAMNKVKGLENIKSSNEDRTDEIKLIVNKEKAAEYGLNALTVSQSASGYFKDTKVMDVVVDDNSYEVYISPKTNINPTLESLKDATITNMTGSKIPLLEVCTLERGKGYSKINRKEQLREISLTADLEGKALSEAVKEIKKNLENYEVMQGYEVIYGGEIEQMMEAFSQLLLALILAIILVYMVMAAQFESLINPFIIMGTVPLAFVGAILTLFFTGVTISIPAMIGFVMLTGIIVNNGIVLIDFINQKRQEGLEITEAIVLSGKVRLQPILMTALTTIIGLLPMALGLGEGNEIQLPLALTVIGGLSVGTILTLIVVPVVYSIFDVISMKFKNRKKK